MNDYGDEGGPSPRARWWAYPMLAHWVIREVEADIERQTMRDERPPLRRGPLPPPRDDFGNR